MKKKSLVYAGILAALLALSGCGEASYSSGESSNGYFSYDGYDGGIYEASDSYSSGVSAEEKTENVRDGRKLIRTAELSVETVEFDKLLSYVEDRTDQLGGYVENMNVNNGSGYGYGSTSVRSSRNASLTLRIPAENMDDFLTEVAENSNITRKTEREEDVTLDYVDLDSHKAVLLAEQERLLALMEQAQSIEEMIILEERLSEIRYQIESMERRLRTYDNQITYATIYLSITEVVELTPIEVKERTVWERIGDGFMESLTNIGKGFQEFFVWFVVAIPYLVLLAVFILLVLWITLASVKHAEKKKKARLAQNPQMKQPPNMVPYGNAGPIAPPPGMGMPPAGMVIPPSNPAGAGAPPQKADGDNRM